MGNRVFLNKQFSNYLGEQRGILDVIVSYQSDIPITPTPTPSVTFQPTPTVTPTPTYTTTPTPTPTLPQGTTEALAYLNAVVVTGGTVDATMSAATITFYQGLYTNNLWDKLYAFYPFMGGTASSHAVEGKLTYTMTWNGGMSHNTDGAVGNGTNGYGNTFFNPDTVIGDGSSSSMGVYVTVLGAVGNRIYDAGANEGTLEQQFNIASRRVTGLVNEVLFDCGNYFPSGHGRVSTTTTDGTGMTIGTARSDADRELYRNGSSIATQPNSRTLTYTARDLFFACQNEGGVPNYYNSNTWGFFFMGKGLDDTDASNLSTLINNYQTALARNTY